MSKSRRPMAAFAGYGRMDLQTFKGIPYGGPVSGAHRFKAAPPLQPWTGVRDALKGGAPSLQTPLRPYFGISEALPAEDCLFLNVWTPAADGQKRPVMFYSHGGGFSVDPEALRTRTAARWRARGTWLWSKPITGSA